MYVILRLGTRDNRKSTDLQLLPAVFVVCKWTEKSQIPAQSGGLRRSRQLLGSTGTHTSNDFTVTLPLVFGKQKVSLHTRSLFFSLRQKYQCEKSTHTHTRLE